jgi:hypothetical protein
VGVYVDVLRLEEPTLITGIYGGGLGSVKPSATLVPYQGGAATDVASVKPSAQQQQQQPAASQNCVAALEELLSTRVENSTPVTVQVNELNQYLPDLNAQKTLSGAHAHAHAAQQQQAVVGVGDLQNTLSLLERAKIPCCALVAKVVALRLSGGRRHRDVLRAVRKEQLALGKTLGQQGATTAALDSVTSKGAPHSIAPVRGYLMVLKGRVGGAERSRVLRYRSGPLPRHTVSAAIDHGFSEVNTPSGKVSVTIMAYFG